MIFGLDATASVEYGFGHEMQKAVGRNENLPLQGNPLHHRSETEFGTVSSEMGAFPRTARMKSV
jgi:hypothetical protein